MPLINKVFPGFYNGMSEQSAELILDTQCVDMDNCMPSIITGTTRRNGTVAQGSIAEAISGNSFHSYDRGEGSEEYLFFRGTTSTNPLRVFTKDGVERTVTYDSASNTHAYLGSVDNLKGLTLQDRTYLLRTDAIITQGSVGAEDSLYKRKAYYWLKRSSNDLNNHYRYAVYLDGVTFDQTGDNSDEAATALASTINSNANYTATAIGSIIEIQRTNGADFTFSSWDSWGDQASIGFKGAVGKMTDLPKDMPFDNVYVHITGDDKNEFNDYYVKWVGDNWSEWKDPTDTRGSFINMPYTCTRQANGSFHVSTLSWEQPTVGNADNNPNPSFVGSTLEDIFFYKNRLGFASGDNIILSETGGYENFYIKTVLDVLDDDPIDVAIASTQAAKVYYVKPFQRGLYIFTKDTQFELISEGTLSPATVAIVSVSNYTMSVDVEPVVAGTSLYFISNTAGNKSQLREYQKDEDSLVSKGVNVTLSTPTLLPSIDKLVINSTLGFIACYSESTKDTLYIVKTEHTGQERVQSAIFKWSFGFNIENIYIFGTDLYMLTEASGATEFLNLGIIPVEGDKGDIGSLGALAVDFTSSITLSQWMPKLGNMRSPLDNVQIKRANIYGTGEFNVDIFRKGYNTTISRTYASGSLKNMSASIIGRSDDVVITIKSNLNKDFNIDSLTLEGFFRQSSREVQ